MNTSARKTKNLEAERRGAGGEVGEADKDGGCRHRQRMVGDLRTGSPFNDDGRHGLQTGAKLGTEGSTSKDENGKQNKHLPSKT